MSNTELKHWPSVALSCLVAFSILIVSALFYVRSRDSMQEEIRARLTDIATTAAATIDGDALAVISTPDDMNTQEYAVIEKQLNAIRVALEDIRFAYILRRTENLNELEFVADADTARTDGQLDRDGNGKVDSYEEAAIPGDRYNIEEVLALQEAAFEAPTADEEITFDQWGAVVSGYAPIRNSNKEVVAVLGIDMVADKFLAQSQKVFSPLILIFLFFGGILSAVVTAYFSERRQRVLLKRMNGERSGLLRLTFHQLGEPLTIMKWSLETLREETESPELKMLVNEHVTCMDEGLGRLNSIIDTLQLAEKVDLNTLEYIPVEASLAEALENSIGEWRSTATKQQQTIELHLDKDVTLPLDRAHFSLIMRQLLVNAIEYSPANSVIHVRIKQHQRHVGISVEDSGCGIPTADMQFLFQKYRRASNAHLKKPDGNGLGLYIARGIIERAGGSISVQSIEGRGTTVSFTLPLSK